MLDALKRLVGATSSVPQEAWQAWCKERSLEFKVVRDPAGFVVDGPGSAAPAWRLEWGPSQRVYIEGDELRLRADIGQGLDVQAMLLDRALHQSLERKMFEEYVGDVQTRVDTDMPPEMRWLVMLNKVPGAALKNVRSRYAAVASDVAWATRWFDGPLSEALFAWPADRPGPQVLTMGRGRLTLRMPLAQPTPAAVEPCIALFEAAREQAIKACATAAS